MKYKCSNCGEVFDESEFATVREDRGEFWGFPAYEDVNVCPRCKLDEYEEYDESEGEDDNA